MECTPLAVEMWLCEVSLLGSWRGFHLRLRAQGFYWGYSCGHPLPVKCQPQKEADACHKSHHWYTQFQLAYEQDLLTPGEFKKPGSQSPVQGRPGRQALVLPVAQLLPTEVLLTGEPTGQEAQGRPQ